MSTAIPKTKKKSKSDAKPGKRPNWTNPNTAMRQSGYVLLQTWASPALKTAIDAHSQKTGKFKSDLLREVIGAAAEKWSGAETGSLQALRAGMKARPVKSGGKTVKDGKSKTAKPAAKSNSKSAVAKSAAKKKTTAKPAGGSTATKKVTVKPAAKQLKSGKATKSVRKPAPAARQSKNSLPPMAPATAQDVVAEETGAGVVPS